MARRAQSQTQLLNRLEALLEKHDGCGATPDVVKDHSEFITQAKVILPEIRDDVKTILRRLANTEKDVIRIKTERRMLTGVAGVLGAMVAFVADVLFRRYNG